MDASELERLDARLRDEVNVPAGDDARIRASLETAALYVERAIGGYSVPGAVRDDCIISCAADLYNGRDARLGVMDAGDPTLTQPFRVSSDPLRGVWAKLNAAGVPTGGLVVA